MRWDHMPNGLSTLFNVQELQTCELSPWSVWITRTFMYLLSSESSFVRTERGTHPAAEILHDISQNLEFVSLLHRIVSCVVLDRIVEPFNKGMLKRFVLLAPKRKLFPG